MNKSGELSATFVPLGAVMPWGVLYQPALARCTSSTMSALGH